MSGIDRNGHADRVHGRVLRLGRGPVRAVLGGAAALAVAATVSACSAREAGSAAVVGDRRITVDQLDAATNGIRTGNPQLAQTDGLQRTVLFYLAISPYVDRRAQAAGAGVSDAEARSQLPKATDPDAGSVAVLRTALSLQKLQSTNDPNVLKTLQDDIVAAHIRVSPRYGTFDDATFSVVDASPNWLAATPSAQPTQPNQPTQQP